jgi:hypothetical protein
MQVALNLNPFEEQQSHTISIGGIWTIIAREEIVETRKSPFDKRTRTCCLLEGSALGSS